MRKVEDAPEIENGVFHRRAREHDSMFRLHGFDRLRVLCLAILDVLRLVEHECVVLKLVMFLRVTRRSVRSW